MAGGRPTKLNDEITIQICKLVELGISPPKAANYCGISRQTYYNWVERAKQTKTVSKYTKFFDKITEAQGQLVKSCHLDIIDSKDWKAKQWLLEHLDKFEYGTVQKLEVKHEGKIDTKIEHDFPDNPELRAKIAGLLLSEEESQPPKPGEG